MTLIFLPIILSRIELPGFADSQNSLFSHIHGNCSGFDEPFIIGSISKTFTAAAVMQLVEKGKVELDVPLSRYLENAAEGQHITIRQLLNHTSGIDTYMTLDNYSVTSKHGTYVYANANYGLLGIVIEAVSGMSYSEYLETNIFRPLGMKHTYTSLEEAKKDGLIAGYRNNFGFEVAQECDYPDKNSREWLTTPVGYIISTASDMNRYLQSYLNGDGTILTNESIAYMFGETVPVAENNSYGFGWGVLERDGTKIISHGGLVDNYICQAFMIPELKICGVILMNSNDYFVGNAMKHLLLDALYLCLVLISVFLKVPIFLKVPMYVVARFAPDFFLIIIVSAALAYFTGLIKIALTLHLKQAIKEVNQALSNLLRKRQNKEDKAQGVQGK